MFKSIKKLFNFVQRKPGCTLDQTYYLDNTIFTKEIEKIWKKNWLFAGHTLSLKNPGDYFLFDCKFDFINFSYE